MSEWLRTHGYFLLALGGGILLSVLTAERHSLQMAAVRVSAGLICGWFFTDPTLDWLALDPDIYRNAVAALWGMSGYAVTRMVNTIRWERLFDIIKAWRAR